MSKKILKEKVQELRAEDVKKVLTYVNGLLEINHEDLNRREEECVKNLGYNPTSNMEAHEWDRMLKLNQMSLEKESK